MVTQSKSHTEHP